MTKSRVVRNIFIGIFAVLIIAGLVFGVNLAMNWQKPLNQSLDLPTYTPSLVPPSSTPVPTRPGEPTATATLVPTATPVPLCGGPAVLTILAIGSDNRAGGYLYGLADVMRVVRVDFVNAKITVVDLPRDIWVDIPGISDHYNIKQGKLNQAYFYGNPGMGYYDGPGEGPGLLARTIDQNFGLRADNYIAVDMQTFVKFVNALGGIDVYLPEDVDGRPVDAKTEDMGYFYAGKQHLNGAAALRLARVRKKYNTFKRTSNQNIILCGIKEKALSPEVLPRIPQIIASFQNSMQTDLSPEQISQLACLAPEVKRSNLLLASMPEELFTGGSQFDPTRNDNTFVLKADFNEIRDLLAQFQSGAWPTPSEDGGEACPTPLPTRTPKPK